MTCIVGIKHNDEVWLGADSFSGSGDRHGLVVHPKVFRLFEPAQKRPLLLAICGSVRVFQLLRYALPVPAFDRPVCEASNVMRYLVNDFCPALKTCFDKGGILQKKDGEDYYDGSAILGFEEKLFVLTNGFTFEETRRDFFAFAAGGEYASGSLFHTQGLPPEERIRMALEAACDLNQYVAPPFHIEKL